MRRRLIVGLSLVVALLIAGVIYKKWLPLLQKPAPSQNTNSPKHRSSSVPPFSTREPQRYQATRIVRVEESEANKTTPVVRVTRVFIVRDGTQRREEYEAGAQGTIVFLESVSGRFVLLPQTKLYADLNEPDNEAGPGLDIESEIGSPDLLLHESNVSSQYQKLTSESVAGRVATKYRVTSSSADNSSTSETLIWIDEQRGMPIRSELVQNRANGSTKVTMELVDVSEEVYPGVFVLPSDYRKVKAAEIFKMIRR